MVIDPELIIGFLATSAGSAIVGYLVRGKGRERDEALEALMEKRFRVFLEGSQIAVDVNELKDDLKTFAGRVEVALAAHEGSGDLHARRDLLERIAARLES